MSKLWKHSKVIDLVSTLSKNDIRCYSELKELKTFQERFEYLKLDGSVGVETFGYDRYLNQIFYRDPEWKRIRREVIIRDEGCDLGILGYELRGMILIHHMNPITPDDIAKHNPDILDPEYLITTCRRTHDAIHYGAELPEYELKERKPNDTCPWR